VCGIAGYLAEKDVRGARTLLDMTRALAHRGPDDEGLAWIHPPTSRAVSASTDATAAGARCDGDWRGFDDVLHRVGLGHRRFSIVDLSPGGHQPFRSSDGRLWLSFNGEIYNHVELRAELEKGGRQFRTESDTEVLLQAFEEWGTQAFERFAGFWALALYDARRRAVLLARDRLGKAPLYLARHGGRLWWASEIKALAAGAGPSLLDVRGEAVSEFLLHGWRDVDGGTFYRGVESLPAASFAWLRADGALHAERWWELPRERLRERDLSPEDAATGLRERLAEALRVRLRADVLVGVELSGGMDSSALVALAAEAGRPLNAYTIRYKGSDAGEESWARRVAKRYADLVHYQVVEHDAADFFDCADGYVAHMEEPFHSPNMLANQAIWRAEAEQGVRVSIGGGAGDELLAGYPSVYFLPYLASLLGRGRLPRLLREAAAFSEAPVAMGSRTHLQRLRLAGAYALAQHRPRREAARSHADALAGLPLRGLPAPRARPPAEMATLLREQMGPWKLAYWLRSGHTSHMQVPMELRAPFLDHRVVDYAMQLPLSYLIRDGWHKWVLRRAVQDLLPEEIVWRRRKTGFPFPYETWLAASQERFFDALGDSGPPWVDLPALRQGWMPLAKQRPRQLWRLMSVCLWWRRCVEGRSLTS